MGSNPAVKQGATVNPEPDQEELLAKSSPEVEDEYLEKVGSSPATGSDEVEEETSRDVNKFGFSKNVPYSDQVNLANSEKLEDEDEDLGEE